VRVRVRPRSLDFGEAIEIMRDQNIGALLVADHERADWHNY